MTEQTTTTTYRAHCLTCGTKWLISATHPAGAALHATERGHTVQVTTTTVTTHNGTHHQEATP